jgi:hypothetical protein
MKMMREKDAKIDKQMEMMREKDAKVDKQMEMFREHERKTAKAIDTLARSFNLFLDNTSTLHLIEGNRDKNTATRKAPSAVDRDFLVALRKNKNTIGKLFGIDPGFVENWVSSLPQLIPACNEAAHQATPEMILLALRTKKDPAKRAVMEAAFRLKWGVSVEQWDDLSQIEKDKKSADPMTHCEFAHFVGCESS